MDKRWIQRSVRLAGLLLFAFFLFRSQGTLEGTLSTLAGIDPLLWIVAFVCGLSAPLIVPRRMQGLLRSSGHPTPYSQLAGDSLRSNTLNTITLMGAGDLYRAQRLRGLGVPLAKGGAVVVLDRLVGIATLAALVVALQLAGLGRALELPKAWLVVGSAGLLLGVVAITVKRRAVGRFIARRAASVPRLAPLVTGFERDFLSPSQLAPMVGLSLAICAAWVLCVYFLGSGLGLPVAPLRYLEVAPVVALATLLPISIGGIGVRETGYLLLLGAHGATPAQCIALGLAQYSVSVGIALVGALLFLRPERRDGDREAPRLPPS